MYALRRSHNIFLPEAILGSLAAPLPEVGHHGVGSIAANSNLALGPALSDEGLPVVKVSSFDVFLRSRAEELMSEVVPNVSVGVSRHLVVKLVEEPPEFRLRVLFSRLLVDPSGWLPDKGEPLLPLPPSIGRNKVLVLPQENLVRYFLYVGSPVLAEGSVTGKPRVPAVCTAGHEDAAGEGQVEKFALAD